MTAVRLTIQGQPCSKANSRRLVTNRGRPMVIKSKKALAYEAAVRQQVPVMTPLMAGELAVYIDIYYASERPDLDESIILDALQKRVYANDRQIREKHVRHFIDKDQPRVEMVIEPRRPFECSMSEYDAA